ncbi:MAG: alpha/beta fold hydrolase [Deltaproteobacteria bacterium]
MPLISSSYRAPVLFSNPHLQTVCPSLFRRVRGVDYERIRIDTPDGDFLDLDFSRSGSNRVAILLHGLEGNSTRAYVLGMVRALNRNGWDALAMNFRGCSGECNRKLRFYHSGDTQDLRTVLSHVSDKEPYAELVLIGFSIGGNIVLKYLGECGNNVPPIVRKAVTFSVPCDLASSSYKLAELGNRLYLKRFLRMLHQKIQMKMEIMPDRIDDTGFRKIKTFQDFDDRYTAPIHGFKDALDYWNKASCKPYLPHIAIPTLLVNSADDPFLTEPCYPIPEAEANPFLFLEIPGAGGHVGFVQFNRRGEYWSESRTISFIER